MSKTIEEAAVGYAADKMCVALGLTPGCINRTDALIPKFCGRDIEEAYEDGENRIMSLPLSGRMTADEKERVRKIYAECELIEMDDSPNLPADRITEATAKIQVLESIFGADFFKER